MDLYILIFALAASAGILWLGFKGNGRAGWMLLGVFAVTISMVTTLVLISDGILTANCGSCPGDTYTVAQAAANGDFVSDFNALSIAVITIPIAEAVATIRKTFRI